MESFIDYLNSHSPEDVDDPQSFLSALAAFLHRGRIEQRRQLLEILSDDQTQPTSIERAELEQDAQCSSKPGSQTQPELSIIIQTPSTYLPSRHLTPPYSQPGSPGSEIELSSTISSSSPEEYFRSRQFQHLSPKRVNSLIKAAVGLKHANDIPTEHFDNLWSNQDRDTTPVASGNAFSRLNEMYHTTIALEKQRALVDCADRFIGLFVRHEVDVLTSGKALTIPVAFEQITKNTGFTNVKQVYNDARNFVHIVELHGPGLLLRLGSEVNSIWKHLSNDNVETLLAFRKLHLSPTAAGEHFHAASLCIQGLIAHGWTGAELVQSDSNLIRHLSEYVDCQKLVEGTIVQRQDPDIRKKRSTHDGGKGPNKRQCRGSSVEESRTAAILSQTASPSMVDGAQRDPMRSGSVCEHGHHSSREVGGTHGTLSKPPPSITSEPLGDTLSPFNYPFHASVLPNAFNPPLNLDWLTDDYINQISSLLPGSPVAD